MFKESKRRSILKTISWRFWATLTTAVLVYIFTGKIELAAAIGGIEIVIKMILYFVHERAWNNVDYGKKLSAADVPYVQVAPMIEYSLHGKLWGWPKLKAIFSNAWYKNKVVRYGRSVWSAYNLSVGFELVW